MHRGGDAARPLLPWAGLLATAALTAVTACGGPGSDAASDRGPASSTAPVVAEATAPDGADAVPDVALAAPTSAPADAATTTAAETPATATPTTVDPDADATDSLDGFATSPRSAPATGTGTALLHDVRVGRHEGFERVVFEFEGRSRPEYRVRWVEGPITADGSGDLVDVDGAAHLEVILTPASGVDMADGTIAYAGPDRVAVAGRTVMVQDLVRTGDFEAVLTWVAGAPEEAPFRVLALADPTRVVVDLRTS